jgi:putative flippase GtrA
MSKSLPIEIRFLLIGGWNTLFGFMTYTAFLWLLPLDFYPLALVFSSLTAGIQAYFTQSTFVWKKLGSTSGQLFRFTVVLILQFLSNISLLYLSVELLQFDELLSQYFIGLIIVTLTFLTHKNWTFKEKIKGEEKHNK